MSPPCHVWWAVVVKTTKKKVWSDIPSPKRAMRAKARTRLLHGFMLLELLLSVLLLPLQDFCPSCLRASDHAESPAAGCRVSVKTGCTESAGCPHHPSSPACRPRPWRVQVLPVFKPTGDTSRYLSQYPDTRQTTSTIYLVLDTTCTLTVLMEIKIAQFMKK